jgi:hypothetical protein
VLSDQQISNFISLNIERGDSFHEVLGDDCRVWKNNAGSRTAVVKAVISTVSDHAPGNVVEICTAGSSNTAIIHRRKRQRRNSPSTEAPAVPNIEDLKPVQL